MSHKNDSVKTRLVIICIVLAVAFAGFSLRMMQLQLVDGAEYRDKVDSTYTSKTEIKAARGEIVDRYGRTLATNKTAYNVVFHRVFMPTDKTNSIINDLCKLMTNQNEKWIDNLPLSYDVNNLEFIENMENQTDSLKKYLKLNSYATAQNVLDNLISKYNISDDFSPEEKRLIAGVRYGMDRAGFSYSSNYTFAQDVSSNTLGLIKEQGFNLQGVDIEAEPIREYTSGTVIPHIIGSIGPIYPEEYEELKSQGYALDAILGKSGIEKSFEEYLKGTNGIRKVVKNKHGDIIEDYVEKEPEPGGVVRLTIDKNFQQFVQSALERNIEYIKNNRAGASESKGAALVVLDTKTFEVLASATYPNYNIDDYSTSYSSLLSAENNPLFNRATMGLYRPGSIFKPGVAATALANGVVTENETVNCSGVYTFYSDYHPECQNRASHGSVNVNRAISVSCNIFFYEMGRRLGINAMNEGVSFFGYGQATGIQVPEAKGVLSSPDVKNLAGTDWYPGDTLQAAIGQSDTSATPLQLAVYTATLANGGERLQTSVVNEVKSNDYSQTLFKNEKNVLSQFDNKNNALEIVKKAMVTCSRSGSAQSAFRNYPVDVASKTGSPQTATNKSDGTFITYGPADDPEIAIAIVGENITHGYYLASLAKEIYDYYFYTKSINAEIKPSGQLVE